MPFNFPLAPPSASSFAGEYDALFYTLTAFSAFFFFLVMAGVIVFAVRYRQGSKADRSRPVYEDLRLELTLLTVPAVLGIIFFYFGAKQYIHHRTPPKDAQDIFVIGKQWMWHVQHPNGVRENNTLHVPAGRNIRLTMISQDVIHQFFVPAFRTQFMVVPGRYTTMWFKPTRVGEYHLFCNQYCGTQHAEMGGKVIVMEPREYTAWLANGGESQAPMTMAQRGEKLYNGRLACSNCHGATDSPRGPSLANLFGKRRTFSNAPAQLVDDEYLRESILRPYNKLTAGYGQEMPAYESQLIDGKLTEENILELISYMKTMGAGTAGSSQTSVGGSNLNLQPLSIGNESGPATNAMAAQREYKEGTPTSHGTNPAVNAYAVENNNR
ncbi:cytochrome c oxidase subunit II [bacterium]|nr:MAG: cytochrome c oxidase subunit II [bacterium]